MNRHRAHWSAMGSPRRTEEIFAGIEAKATEREAAKAKLLSCIAEIMEPAHCSREAMADMIKEVLIDFIREGK